jgi:hypothetical protein
MVHDGSDPVCLNPEAKPGFDHTDQVSFAFRLTLGLRVRLAERDEPLPIFVPQHQSHARETLKQGQPADAVEVRMVAQHQRQSVKGDAAAQMMDVVNADIGSEPAQRARQGIIGAAVKRRLLQVPFSVADPYGMLELVLDLEQPNTERGREHQDWQMHEQERTDADQPHHGGDDSRDASIGRHRAQPRLPAAAHEADRQAMLHEKQIGRADAEHNDRMPVDAVAKAAPSGACQVFLYGERVDVAHPAAIKIAGRRVVCGVGASPKVVWCERQHSDHASDPVVRATTMKKGPMTAIVLDHEEPDQKARGRHRKQ